MPYSFDRMETRPGGLDDEGCPIPHTLSDFCPTQADWYEIHLEPETTPLIPESPQPASSTFLSRIIDWLACK